MVVSMILVAYFHKKQQLIRMETRKTSIILRNHIFLKDFALSLEGVSMNLQEQLHNSLTNIKHKWILYKLLEQVEYRICLDR